jgi:hypothetical protein
VTEYRETGYGSDGYPPREGGDPGRGGTLYGGGARHTRDDDSPSGQDDRSAYDSAASIRGRVWRPTRGPRAEEAARGGDQAYGAPERGWRTSDGGYRSPDGGWRAPYRPYDTGELRRDQDPDTGPTSGGEIRPYSSGSGEIVRYTPPVSGEPPAYWAGSGEVVRYPERTDRTEEAPRGPAHTGEIVPYRGGTGDIPRYPNGGQPASGVAQQPASGAPRYPTSGGSRYPASGVPRHQDDTAATGRYPAGRAEAARRPGGTGEIERYPGPTNPRGTGEIVRYSGPPGVRGTTYRAEEYRTRHGGYTTDGGGRTYHADGTGRGHTTEGSGHTYRTDSSGRGYTTDAGGRTYHTDGSGRAARPGRAAPDAGGAGRMPPDAAGAGRTPPDPSGARAYPTDTGETSRIPSSSAGYPAAPPKRRVDGGRRGGADDSAELYTYDPLTLGGGESPAMRYDGASGSYAYDAAEVAPASPANSTPDPRRAPAADPRTAEPRAAAPRASGPRPADPRAAGPRTADPRLSDGRGYDGRGSGAGAYGGSPRYQRERGPAPGEVPARRPAERRYQDPQPVRRPAARPAQRFEGTYPPHSVRSPRNVVPPRGRRLPADEDADEAPGYMHTALVTTAWYTIPLLLYTMYVLTLDGSAQAGDGESARQNALNGLLGGMPRVGAALVTSLAVALLIRVISKGWRAATIGFASAVVGAGGATVIFAAMQG